MGVQCIRRLAEPAPARSVRIESYYGGRAPSQEADLYRILKVFDLWRRLSPAKRATALAALRRLAESPEVAPPPDGGLGSPGTSPAGTQNPRPLSQDRE